MMEDSNQALSVRLCRVRQTLAVGGLVLLAFTWPLWTAQHVFPRIVLFNFIGQWSDRLTLGVHWIGLGLLVLSSVGLVIGLPRMWSKLEGRWLRGLGLLMVLAWGVLIALDQHRLQPWVAHLSMATLLIVFGRPRSRLQYLGWFTASIYVYSALSKFDTQFLYTVGQEFVGGLLALFGWRLAALPTETRFWMATGLPLLELVIGVGLIFQRTRAVAAVVAIGMHTSVIGLLGPWGLNHAWGVLAWNALFIVLDWQVFLFRPRPCSVRSDADLAKHRGRADESDRGELQEITAALPASGTELQEKRLALRKGPAFGLAEILLVVAVVAPLGERSGWTDHWLGWAVYAPHSSRARIEITLAAADRLPPSIRPFVACDLDSGVSWCEVRIDRWSLAALRAPVYPQQRFQVGVARALCPWIGEDELRVELLSAANRWNGRRTRSVVVGCRQLKAVADQYWFSTDPTFVEPETDPLRIVSP